MIDHWTLRYRPNLIKERDAYFVDLSVGDTYIDTRGFSTEEAARIFIKDHMTLAREEQALVAQRRVIEEFKL